MSIHAELNEKLVNLYGEAYFTGGSLDEVMGDLPFRSSVMSGYEGDVSKFVPEYTVWKSSANGAYLVMSFWYDTNENQHKLKLAYVSDYAEEHFEQMAQLGVFGEDYEMNGYDLSGL
ncbi:MAG: hypothetical protein IKJ65_03170 [Clostridia bacterium]|nr:hypothetical protein [Clostridia bacterium]